MKLTAMNAKKVMRLTNEKFKGGRIIQENEKWGYTLTMEFPCTQTDVKMFAARLNLEGFSSKHHVSRMKSMYSPGYGMVKIYNDDYIAARSKLTDGEFKLLLSAE